MFENRIKRGEISSAQIVDELRNNGFCMKGIERRKFFIEILGMTEIRSYSIGRDSLLIFKRAEWKAKRKMIIGKNMRGYPIIQGVSPFIASTHDRKVKRPVVATQTTTQTSTTEQKVDLLIWAMDEMLQLQARYA